MGLYSYVVARDYGFAPNPFFGVCTLATCKPKIRNKASVGSWVAGTGSAKFGLVGHLVFALKVSEILSYDEYWNDQRFQEKKPNLKGSLKQAYGDNIYHRAPGTQTWVQANSHHSLSNGAPNPDNVNHDTKSTRVLIGPQFVYFGGSAPKLPSHLANICAIRGHRCNFPNSLVASFEKWVISLPEQGYSGDPAEWAD